MTRLLFKPHPDLDTIDPEFRRKWAEDLRSSTQYQGALSNRHGTAHCCLGRACLVAGVEQTRLDERLFSTPIISWGNEYPVLRPLSHEGIKAATDGSENSYSFARLNDTYLSHEQIAMLLDGEEVWTDD